MLRALWNRTILNFKFGVSWRRPLVKCSDVPKEISVRFPILSNPIRVRIRTTDQIPAWLRSISPENTGSENLRDRTGGLDIESAEKSGVQRRPMVGQLELLTERVMEPFERTQRGEADFYAGRTKPDA